MNFSFVQRVKKILILMLLTAITVHSEEEKADCQKQSDSNKVTSCGRLISPKNGQMHLTIGLQSDPQKEPEKALFSCNPGYYLMGPTTITCRDSSWEDKEPVCQPVDCGSPKALKNGRVDYETTTYQSKAYYYCNTCATLVGFQKISCKRSGLWSKSTPTCIFNKTCPPLKLPKSSHVVRVDSTDTQPRVTQCGERVYIRCGAGYRLIGTGIATCQPDGSYKWLGDTVTECRRLNWT